eukprot:gene7871-biopygen21093
MLPGQPQAEGTRGTEAAWPQAATRECARRTRTGRTQYDKGAGQTWIGRGQRRLSQGPAVRRAAAPPMTPPRTVPRVPSAWGCPGHGADTGVAKVGGREQLVATLWHTNPAALIVTAFPGCEQRGCGHWKTTGSTATRRPPARERPERNISGQTQPQIDGRAGRATTTTYCTDFGSFAPHLVRRQQILQHKGVSGCWKGKGTN